MKNIMRELIIDELNGNSMLSDENSYNNKTINDKQGLIGKFVIIRTYSAGNFAGFLAQKDHDEIILEKAYRLWEWKCREGISLSEISLYGIVDSGSRICQPVEKIWLQAIEIIPATKKAQETIENTTFEK